MAGVWVMNDHSLARMTRWAILVCGRAVVAVLFTERARGISGWFSVGARGIQPAEYTKLLIILIVAKFASQQVDSNERIRFNMEFVKTTAIVGLFVLLVMLQPDTGTAMVYMAVYVGIRFAGRLSWKVSVSVVGLVLVVFLMLFFTRTLPDYIIMRVLIFLKMDN